ncbi:hypothetical protein DFP74_3582 [Nocardiopsis sp. Huas11]|uniref:hypothetical protein n=1 Tax=Nocardiopsis sp. Huas11 TaxID=2183912 RepID=UPI000EB46B99|nr:hypothetical protein [Nocardiopsis sp. Huas11]RKS07894.1 hypothetical protein DFP74_3582 [Nocardiopsis sp. Huas11]
MISGQDRPPLGGRTWEQVCAELEEAERNGPLSARDYELLATAAYMIGADDTVVRALEAAHRSHLTRHEPLRAVRCAFWAGLHLRLRGEHGPASGWLGRAARILEREGGDCVERGYLHLPTVLEHDARGEHEAAFDAARHTVEIAERFEDADLFALAVHEQGRALIKLGRLREGLRAVAGGVCMSGFACAEVVMGALVAVFRSRACVCLGEGSWMGAPSLVFVVRRTGPRPRC